ncbi:MAG TPA: hypothetical protein DEV81_00730 [Cyanobacteria bacterium UBA11049]|nr:hypothetical protein [Cyanobacteria bacterium UBA11049]
MLLTQKLGFLVTPTRFKDARPVAAALIHQVLSTNHYPTATSHYPMDTQLHTHWVVLGSGW